MMVDNFLVVAQVNWIGSANIKYVVGSCLTDHHKSVNENHNKVYLAIFTYRNYKNQISE